MQTLIALVEKLPGLLQQAFLPHYKEDAFRTIFAGLALTQGWTVAEPRPANASTIRRGHVAVYELQYKNHLLTARAHTVARSSSSKPDLRLIDTNGAMFTVEIKCGFTGSASEVNSNAARCAADIDLVRYGKCHMFCGLLDKGMLDRVQGRLSSAGDRVKEMRTLLNNIRMQDLHQNLVSTAYQCKWKRAQLNVDVTPVVCASGVELALVTCTRMAGHASSCWKDVQAGQPRDAADSQ